MFSENFAGSVKRKVNIVEITETAFLLKNTEGYFCVVGVPTVSEWCEQEKPAIEKHEEEEDSDDLDFDMF